MYIFKKLILFLNTKLLSVSLWQLLFFFLNKKTKINHLPVKNREALSVDFEISPDHFSTKGSN